MSLPAAGSVGGWVILARQAVPGADDLALQRALHDAGLATLRVDLLTHSEAASREMGFRTALLGARLAAVTRWLASQPEGRGKRVGYLAAGPAAGAALWAAAELRTEVSGVVCLGGRVDLAARRLAEVLAPVLLVVNRRDRLVLAANQSAQRQLNPASRLVVAPSFRYLRYWLAQPAALDRALAQEWLTEHVLGRLVPAHRPRLTDRLPRLQGQAAAAATVLALLASLAGPPKPVEAAGSASVSGGVLTFTAGSGETNDLTVQYYTVVVSSVTVENGYYLTDNSQNISAGTGCSQLAGNIVQCVGFVFPSTNNINSLQVNTNNLNDTITIASLGDPLALDAGDDNDTVNVQALGASATVTTGNGNDTVNAGSDAPQMTGLLQTLGSNLHVQGGTGDVLNLGDRGNPLGLQVDFNLNSAGQRTISSALYTVYIEASGQALTGGVNFNSGSGVDILDANSTRAGEALNLNGDNANNTVYDLMRVGQASGSVQSIAGPLHIRNQQDYSTVEIYDQNDGTGRTATFTAASPTDTLAGLSPANITFTHADIKQVSVLAGSGADVLTLDGSWTNGLGAVPRYVFGGGGNDTFRAGTGLSLNGGFIDGGSNSDTASYELWSTAVSVDLLLPFLAAFGTYLNIENGTGGSGNDFLRGNLGNNNLNGLGGTDTVSSSGDFNFWLFDSELQRIGQDTDGLANIEYVTLQGSSSGQTINAYNQSTYRTSLEGLGGDDWLVGGSLSDTLNGGAGVDTIMGSWGDDTLAGGADADVLREDNDFAVLHVFNSSLTGSTGTDTLTDTFESASIAGGNSSNLIDLAQWSSGPAAVQGRGGDDTIDLGSGNFNDVVDGGSHNLGDRVEQTDVFTAIMLASGVLNTVDSGGNSNGTDLLIGVEGVVLTGTTGADVLNALLFPFGPVSLYGAGGDDFLYGGGFNDLLDGGDGNDSVYGNTGDDTVSGGDGSDTVDGGPDTDTMVLDMGALNVTLTGNSINDSGSNNDDVQNVEQLIVLGGSSGNLFDAGAFGGSVSMYGNGGNDTLIAGTGGGSLDGGAGTQDRLYATDNGGITLSNSAMTKGGQSFAVAGFELASLTGGSSIDMLDASSFTGTVTLVGLDGSDTLIGGSGSDQLDGGDGHDSLVGNAGNDTLDGGTGNDTAVGGSHNDSLVGGGDDDQLFGNLGNNTLKGDAGNDLLVADAGNDSLSGGADSDTLTAGVGANTVDGGSGTDRLSESLAGLTGPFSLILSSSALGLSGGATAADVLSEIEVALLTGSSQNDTLDASGFAGQVTLIGGDGNDELSGAAGNDSLSGGNGSDVAAFKVGDNNVTLSGGALSGQGQDTLDSIEGFRITGGPAGQTLDASSFAPPAGNLGVTLDGAGGADRLIGSNYRDSLIGGTENDTLIGNGEADTLDGGPGTGDVMAALGTGPYTLANASLVTNGVTDVLSNTEEAVITGTTSADLIDAWGFTGRVTLVGDAGSDEFRVGTGGGSLFGDAGVDSLRVLGDTDYQLSDTQLNLTGLGQNYALDSTESVSITAGAVANNLDASAYNGSVTLVGAGGADSLKGGAGDDLLLGGDGNDQLGGGAGADTLDGGNDTTGDVWIESGAVTVTLVTLGFPSVPVDSVSGLERANFTGDGSPNIFNLTSFTGTASLKGGAGNDVLTGGTMADTLEGEAGDDTLTGSGALDSLLGGGGIDRLLGFGDTQFDLTDDRLDGPGTGLDTLSSIEEAVLTGFGGSSRFDASAFSGPVTLIGGDGADTLIGGLVADSLVGDGGDDSLEGRDGNDTLTGLAGNDYMDGGLGTDLLNGFVGNDTLLGDDGNDTLIGAEGSDSVVGGAGNDLLSHSFDVVTTTVGLSMDDTLRGGPGLDTLEGGAGYDVVEEIGDSNYTLTNALLQSTLGNDTLSEFEAARLVGGVSPNLFNTLVFTGAVTLDGQDGDDTFLAGAQNDSLIGGPGGGDQLHASGNFSFALSDVLLTGLGNDSLSLVEQAVITGGVGANNLNAGAFTLGPVTLTGLAGNDTVTGGSGSDSLDAGDGDDTVTGNAGANTLLGGTGTNLLIEASDVHFTLTNSLLTGTTTVPGAGLTDQLSTFALAQLTGGSGPNLINASAFTGSVTLDGGAGDDTLLGALGSDWLRGSADVDQVAAAADVDFTLTNTLLTGLGSDTLENIERASLTGGAGANRLDAGAFTPGAVTLVGAGGNDTLIGGQQSDSLDGGPGDNSFTGGDGDDLFLGSTGLDLVDDSVSGGGSFVLTATLLTGRGTDTLLSIDRVRLTGGSAGNNMNAANATVPVTLMGGPGNDTLVGGPQNDNLTGGTDDDVLTGGAGRDTLDAGAGSNDLLLETINANTLTLNNAALIADFIGIPDTPVSDVLVGNQFEKANLTGGALNNLIDASSFSGSVTLNGLGGDDTLRGNNSGADSLDGGAGNDSLEGLNGADTLRGGSGNDTLKGADGANVLDGQDGNDTLLGGPGGETLLGGAGNDTMTALAGDDSIDGQAGTDLLIELVSGNVVLTDTSMTGLGNDTLASIELVQLTGGATDDTLDAGGYTLGTVTLAGLAGNDVLRGGALADSLAGGDGDDSLTGNGGNDLLDGGIGTDWAVETANGLLVLTNTGLTSTSNGTDTHLSLERASLSGSADNDTLDASAYTLSPVILHGGGGSDSLIGTSLNDSLLGDGGDDFLDGRLGDDSLTGGTETDAAVAAGDLSFTVTVTSLVGNGADALAPDVDGVSLTGGAGANTFDLLNWPGLATISGGGGADLLQVGGSLADDNFLLEADRVMRGAATINFAEVEWLVVNAGDGNDTLVIADSVAAGAAADGAAISALTVSNVTLAGGNGDDLFHMLPQSSLRVHVDGGPHASGDTLEYDASSVALDQQPGLLLPEGKQPTSYVEIEVLDLLRDWLYKVFVPLVNRLP